MIVQNHRAMAAFAVVVGLMSAVAAAFGVFARGDGSYEIVTSVRGVTYPMATSGVYAYNAQRVVAEGVGWDVFTLFVAVPTMLAAAAFVAGGSFRGRLLASGLFGYFLYQYLEYAMTWAFGPLFPLFVLIFGSSLIALIWFGASVARDGIADRFGADFPGRQATSRQPACRGRRPSWYRRSIWAWSSRRRCSSQRSPGGGLTPGRCSP